MKTKITLVLAVFLSLIMFTGCNELKNEPAPATDPLVLKSYRVPERLSNEISKVLNHMFFTNEPKIGRVTISPDGQLLVLAPEKIHEGVNDILEQIKKNNPEPSPSVEVNYWIVGGRKAEASAKLDEFKVIKPALEAIQNKQGNMEFKLIDHVSTLSLGRGNRSKLHGAHVRISQTVSAFSDGSINVGTNIGLNDPAGGSIDTSIETRSDELVVLGQLIS